MDVYLKELESEYPADFLRVSNLERGFFFLVSLAGSHAQTIVRRSYKQIRLSRPSKLHESFKKSEKGFLVGNPTMGNNEDTLLRLNLLSMLINGATSYFTTTLRFYFYYSRQIHPNTKRIELSSEGLSGSRTTQKSDGSSINGQKIWTECYLRRYITNIYEILRC